MNTGRILWNYDRRTFNTSLVLGAWPITTRLPTHATVPCFFLLLPSVPHRTVLHVRRGPLSWKGKWCQVVIRNGNRRFIPLTMSAPDASTQQPEPAPVSPVSGPNAPPSVANVPISPPTVTPEQNEIDPAVAPLVAMFPDFDPNVLEAVYLSNNRDQNAAIEALLSMNNPEVSHPSAAACGYGASIILLHCSISHLLSRYFLALYKSLELSY